MNMSSNWWTVFAAILVVGVSEIRCESTAFPVIPTHLLECYVDDGIYHRANRMPSTFEFFLDLVRKVEDSATSKNLNARELATVLLSYLKLDGIQSIQSYTKDFYGNILPFAPSGDEYFKHRLTLVGLVPKIDNRYMAAFNETLSVKEMCNLHFMLSSSIDPYKREDERCSPLFEESRSYDQAEPKWEWQPYQNIQKYPRHHRRNVDHGEESNRVGLAEKNAHFEKAPVGRQRKEMNMQGQRVEKVLRKRRSTEDQRDKKGEVEAIAPQHPGPQPGNSANDKDKFTIGDQELLSGGEYHHRRGMQSLVQMGHFGRGGGRSYYPMRTGHAMDESVFSGVIPGIPLSECPVVNGVVRTPCGSLTIGTVIAGIAAGLNPEEIPPEKLSVNPSELESRGDRVKNVWATTLAGTVADTISSSALLDSNNLQILKGGWNDSADPRWYLLETKQFRHMTEVAIRGSLDGLLLGINSKEWTNKFPNFKLSQILETYYDSNWGNVGGKYRKLLLEKFVPEDVFRKQTHLMSLVLKKQKTNVVTILNHRDLAREAVDKVMRHIKTMDDKEKSYLGTFLETKIDSAVNMIAVVDSSWGHENLLKIFEVLRNSQVATTPESNLTVVCGNDGRFLLSSRNSAGLHSHFTKEALFNNCTRGMNLALTFDVLDTMYRKIYYEEKMSGKMNADAQVAILFPFESPLQENLEYVTEKSRNFRRNFPDVRLMIASNGRYEGFQSMVKDQKDLFSLILPSSEPTLRTFKVLADGVKQSFQRVTRPSCGSYFDDQSAGGETQFTSDLVPGNTVYYRLQPQYFYTVQGEATITVRSKLRAPLTVCHSREMERPAGPTPRGSPGGDPRPNWDPNYSPDFPPEARPYESQIEADGPVQCKTITTESYKIQLSNPCEGASSLQECQPLYISLAAPFQETVSIICPNCRLPTNTQYEISQTGLTCYNSATTIFLSPIVFSLLLALFFFK